MTVEDRLRQALARADEYEPSPDLWSRVQGSIEEDRAHQRRLRRTWAAIVLALGALAATAALFLEQTDAGRSVVDWRAAEVVETLALASIVIALGPAIRRFGRGYANVVFRANPTTGSHFLRLLDVAYYLIFTGYILATMQFQRPVEAVAGGVAAQVDGVAARIGGLLLLNGVLHALTFAMLPLVGVVFTLVWRQAEPRKGRGILMLLVLAFAAAGLAAMAIVFGLWGGG